MPTHNEVTDSHGQTTDETSMVQVNYQSLAEIGSGGMGVITLARALTGPASGRFVAVKRLHPHLERDPEYSDGFVDEVWLTAALRHSNVLEPLDWGRDTQGQYLVTEFVFGDSLRQLLRASEAAGQTLPIAVVVEIIACAAAGLHASHELSNDAGEPLNVVHRDVSPANILVGFDGSVKIIDFGVARRGERVVTTKAGTIKGKVGYMSPEHVRGRDLDRRSDVFSLGVVAWEALTLCRLFAPPTEFDAIRMICEEETIAPSEIRADVPTALDRVILRCLEKQRDRRFASCHELESALAPFRLPESDARLAVGALAESLLPERRAWFDAQLSIAADPTDVGAAVDATQRAASPLDLASPFATSTNVPDSLATPSPRSTRAREANTSTVAARPGALRAASTTATSSAADRDTHYLEGPPSDDTTSRQVGNVDPTDPGSAPGNLPATSLDSNAPRAHGGASSRSRRSASDRFAPIAKAALFWAGSNRVPVIALLGVAIIALVLGLWLGNS